MKVIDEEPNATKKGLRMKVREVVVNDKNEIIGLWIEWSDYRTRGYGLEFIDKPIQINSQNGG